MARFVIVPQWQGSPSARAMQLIEGAQAIAGDLPRAACTTIDVPLEAGEALGTGIHRYSALARVRGMLDAELAQISEPVVTIGGDCAVSVPAIGAAARRSPGTAVVWFDAHPDLNLPDTSPSGAFSGMALSAVLGEGPAELRLESGTVSPDRVVLAGVRDIDAGAERERTASMGPSVFDPERLADAAALVDAVVATGAESVYVHVDLDVLDPAVITGVTSPMPFGIDVPTLVAAISALRAAIPLSGATIAGFAPASPTAAVDDLGSILRIVGSLV